MPGNKYKENTSFSEGIYKNAIVELHRFALQLCNNRVICTDLVLPRAVTIGIFRIAENLDLGVFISVC
jgi:hypothetical protein